MNVSNAQVSTVGRSLENRSHSVGVHPDQGVTVTSKAINILLSMHLALSRKFHDLHGTRGVLTGPARRLRVPASGLYSNDERLGRHLRRNPGSSRDADSCLRKSIFPLLSACAGFCVLMPLMRLLAPSGQSGRSASCPLL